MHALAPPASEEAMSNAQTQDVRDAARDTARSADHGHSVQHFLDRLGQALTAGRADVVAKMWEAPAFVVGDAMVHAVGTAGEVEAFFRGAREQYNSLGIVDTRAEIRREQWLTERLVMVEVRWPHLDAKGQEVGSEVSTYTLRVDDDGHLRLRVAVMHGATAPH